LTLQQLRSIVTTCATATALIGLMTVGLTGCEGLVAGGEWDGERSTAASGSAAFSPLQPYRLLDTRGGERLGSGTSRCVKVTGQGGVPASAKAVTLNLTVVSPLGAGYLTAYPDGSSRPGTSSLNHDAGQVAANNVIVAVGGGGRICAYVHSATHLIIDVLGYFGTSSAYAALPPYRRLDTRSEARPASGSTRCLVVAGHNGVPASARAVAVNLVAVSPGGNGYLTAYPRGIAQPGTSSLNYSVGQTTANGAIVEVGNLGQICIYVHSATHLIVDVSGYFGAASTLKTVQPYRRLDTRGGAQPGPGSTRCVRIAGQDGIPASAGAVAINLTAVAPAQSGYLTLFPDGHGRPGISSLNVTRGLTRANSALVQPGTGGKVCVFTLQATHLVIDVVGYWPGKAASCTQMVCNNPPPPTCVGGDSLVTHAKKGTCHNGTCVYPSSTKRCLAGCAGNACRPTYGWDYNLTHRCVRSVSPGQQNFFQDATDCPQPNKNWTVAVQSEKTLQNTCVGPKSQSLPINAGGPLTLQWLPHTDEHGRKNWTVVLKTDLYNHAHPCGPGTFTWYSLMDHRYHGGGPHPRPDKAILRTNLWYDDWTPSGASRLIAAWGGDWSGGAAIVEIDLQSRNWGDAYPGDPLLIQRKNHPNFQWVSLSGKALGLTVPRKQQTRITINWRPILEKIVARGWLTIPQGKLSAINTSSLSLATEVRNASSSKAATAELRVTDFRVDDH
jgi:hypothetical protein